MLPVVLHVHQHLWSHHDDIHHHKRRYSSPELFSLLEKNGWKIKYISHFNTFLFPFAYIERKIKSLLNVKEQSLKIPSRTINWLLEKIFSLEKFLIGTISIPFGLSIILLAEPEEK